MSFWSKLGRVAANVVTLGLPIIVRMIARKNPKSSALAIAAEIVDAVLVERPDLYETPGLYSEVRGRVQASPDLSEADKRAVLAAVYHYIKSD